VKEGNSMKEIVRIKEKEKRAVLPEERK